MLDTGDTLHGYRIDSELGRGGMGVVYRATQLSLDRAVALKVLSGDHRESPGFRERFVREGRVAASLDHPNIVPVFEAGDAEGRLFIAMRLIEGPTLADLIAEQAALRWQRALEIMAPIASALDAAHAAGLVHRDVKPQNILISSGGHPYLADFGLMRPTRSSGVTRVGEWLGSPDYAAPEHMTDKPYTGAGDVYSLTAVLFHAITGRLPYERGDDLAVLHAHATAPPPKVSELYPRAPRQLDKAIAQGMAKDPADRPGSASELVEHVGRALRQGNVDPLLISDPDISPRPRSRLRGRQRRSPTKSLPAAHPSQDAPVPTAPLSRPVAVEPAGGRTVPEHRRPPRRPTTSRPPPKVRLGSRRPVLVGAGLALAAAAAGALIASGGSDRAKQRIERPALTLTLTAGWQISTSRITLLRLSSRIAASRTSGPNLVAGKLENARSGVDPVPAAHAGAWTKPALPTRVALGSIAALRYDASLRGSAVDERLYAIPTTAGYVAISCRGPRPTAATWRRRCDETASTIELSGARSAPLSPNQSTAAGLAAALGPLIRSRRAQRSAIRAKTMTSRARGAAALAGAHRAAAARLRRVRHGPQDDQSIRRVETSVLRLAQHLDSLARAARRGERGNYEAARGRVDASDGSLRSVLARLRASGYRVG